MLRLLLSFMTICLATGATGAAAAPDKVLPFEGVLDRSGLPFTGSVRMNFALLACPGGNCDGVTPVWTATGPTTSFPETSVTGGFNVVVNGGKFSVLLGDNGQAPLVAGVWQTPQLHVRIAILGGATWVTLTGTQRIAPVPTAITAEEAASFTVRQNLQVNGTANVNGLATVGNFKSTGNADVDGSLNVDGSALMSGVELRGTTNKTNLIFLNDQRLQLRGGNDPNHRLQHGTTFGVDGPELFGFNGGALATVDGGPRFALRWDTGGVTVNGNMAASSISTTGNLEITSGSFRRKGDDLFVVCERSEVRGVGGGTQQEIVFSSASDCGGHAPPVGTEWVGALTSLDICGQANNVDVQTSGANPRVRWFQGTSCNPTTFRVKAIFFRIK